MLDNRYEFDKISGDRLGEEQWQWLDDALNHGKREGATITIIGAGVQMLPDRRMVESFKWKNKQKLFGLLKRHRMSNVVLISGDVHMG